MTQGGPLLRAGGVLVVCVMAAGAATESPWDRVQALSAVDPRAVRLEEPRAMAAMVTEFPAVDRALSRPLEGVLGLRKAAEATLRSSTPSGVIAAIEPWAGAGPAQQLPATGASVVALWFDSAEGVARTAHLPPLLVVSVRRLAVAVEHANTVLAPWSSLRADLDAAEDPEWLFVDPTTANMRFRAGPSGRVMRALRVGDRVDRALLVAVGRALTTTVEQELLSLRRVARRLEPSPGPLLLLDFPFGKIIVGSTGADTWASDAALLIDLGGNDRWQNNGGGNLGRPGTAALAIDVGGKDDYRDARAHVQGSAAFGVGVLVDLDGDDRYTATAQAQGSGWWGLGLLWDTAGADTYTARSGGQGHGVGGIGLLVDRAGDDQYAAKARAQGFGALLGFGGLVDAAGDDVRRLGEAGESADGAWAGWGQGAALGHRGVPFGVEPSTHGGVGLLADGGGDDVYSAGSWAQGAAVAHAAALLFDRSGDDRYTVERGGQGFARSIAVAALVDERGDDVFEASAEAQGAAVHHAFAWLDDGAGDDAYLLKPREGVGSGSIGQAAVLGDGAAALLTDRGGNDSYSAQSHAQGARGGAAIERKPSWAALLDGGGKDGYALLIRPAGATASDGAYWSTARGAVGIDGRGPVLPVVDVVPGTEGAAAWDGRSGAESVPGPSALDPITAALEVDWRTVVEGSTDPALLQRAEAQLHSELVGARRLAGRIVAAAGRPEGVAAMLSTWAHHDDEHRPSGGPGTMRAALALLLGEDGGDALEGWLALGARTPLSERLITRWPAVQWLERAALHSAAADGAACLDATSAAVSALPGDDRVLARAAALALYWAELAGHPDSLRVHDRHLALRAAELAVLWAPDRVEAFIALARTADAVGDAARSRRALEQAQHLDPDSRTVLALRRHWEGAAAPQRRLDADEGADEERDLGP